MHRIGKILYDFSLTFVSYIFTITNRLSVEIARSIFSNIN